MLLKANPVGVAYSESLPPTTVAAYQSLGYDAVRMYGEGTPPFKLWQNYPNPFQRFTTFTFSVSSTGDVSLRLYNAGGMEIEGAFRPERCRNIRCIV